MKTVSGKVISSKPISISKASRVLSTFISPETGASQAVSAYLRRASAAFIELTKLHKELKTSQSERKRKKHRSLTTNSENPNEDVENSRGPGSVFEGDLNTSSGREQSHRGSKGEVLDGNEENDSVGKKEKKKQKNRGNSSKFSDNHGKVDVGESEVCGSMVIEEQKRKSIEAEDDYEARRSKKKKRRRSEGDD